MVEFGKMTSVDQEVFRNELTPVFLDSSETTEVKMPVNTYDVTDVADTSTVDPRVIVDDVLVEDSTNSEFRELKSLFSDYPSDMFINRLLIKHSQCEVTLERLRCDVFDRLKYYDDDFPYGLQCELKRRVRTRQGDTVAWKLAKDIHTIVSVIEGGEYSELKELISSGKSGKSRNYSVAETNKSTRVETNDCQCSAAVKVLQDTVSNLSADMVSVKQKCHGNEQIRLEQIKTITKSVTELKQNIRSIASVLSTGLENINLCIQRIESDKCSGVSSAKADIKLLRQNMTDMDDKVESLSSACNKTQKMLSKHKHMAPVNITHTDKSVCNSTFADSSASSLPAPESPDSVRQIHAPLHTDLSGGSDVGLDGNGTPNVTEGNHTPGHNMSSIDDNAEYVAILISPNYVVRTGTETVVSHTSTMSDTSLTVVSEQRNEGSAQCDLNTDGSIDSLPLGHDNASHVHNDTCLNDQRNVRAHGNSEHYNSNFDNVNNSQITTTITSANIESSQSVQRAMNAQSTYGNSSSDNAVNIPVRTTRFVRDNTPPHSEPTNRSKTHDENQSWYGGGGRDDDVTADDTEDDGFTKYVKKRTLRFYLGGFEPTITENLLYRYVESRGPKVTLISIWPSRRNKENVVIRLNVEDNNDSSKLESPYFWPPGIECRPWRSQAEIRQSRSARVRRYNPATQRYGRSDIDDYNPYMYPEGNVR